MSAARTCGVPECGRPYFSSGYCKRHYDRWRRHGDPNVCLKPMSTRGAPRAWIEAHKDHDAVGCLIWPFARFPDGRAHMKDGKPARVMCETAHGPPPSPTHQAAHSCGKAHDGCVHPGHLRWATPVENAADMIGHDTVVQGERHYAAKLTADDVRRIRGMAGTMLQKDIAAEFGVQITCVSKIINGQSWRHVT